MTKFHLEFVGRSLYVNGQRARRARKLDSSRMIYLFKGKIVKMAHPSKDPDFGNRQCRAENALWHSLSRSDRKFFAPVLQFGNISYKGMNYEYVIQRFISGRDPLPEEMDPIWLVAKRYGVYDMGSENVKKTPRGFKIVDYGLNS